MTKGPEAFRTISEAAEDLGVPQHVLRFWETKFSFIRPMKRAGGRRFYRPQDLVLLRGVRALLHEDGYTIKGVQKLHRDLGVKRLVEAGSATAAERKDWAAPHSSDADEDLFVDGEAMADDTRERLERALDALESAKAHLDRLISAE